MTKSATLTLRVSEDLKQKLGQLAETTQRTPSALAQRGLAAFVDQELALLAAVDEGLEDFRLGNVVTHEEAMKRIRATIAKYEI